MPWTKIAMLSSIAITPARVRPPPSSPVPAGPHAAGTKTAMWVKAVNEATVTPIENVMRHSVPVIAPHQRFVTPS